MANTPSPRSSRSRQGTNSQPTAAPRVSKAAYAEQVRKDSIAGQKGLFEQHGARGSWEKNYTPLAEIQEISHQKRGLRLAEARSLVKELYDEGDSRGFKIAQELFCATEDVVVPGDHRITAEGEHPHLPTKKDEPSAYSQVGLLYTKVPMRFAENTGLLERTRRSTKEVVAAGADLRVVTGAKFLMETVQNLGDRAPDRPNAAVLYFSKPKKFVETRYAPLFTELGIEAPTNAIGSVLYVRQAIPSARPNTSHVPPRKICQVFATVDDALRKTHHERNQYEQESRAIVELMSEWQRFAQFDLLNWVSARELEDRTSGAQKTNQLRRIQGEASDTNEAITSTYSALITKSLEFLSGARHIEKNMINDRLTKMKARFDRSPSGRINPGPVLLQVDANYSLLSTRLNDIKNKGSFNFNDQLLLGEVISAEAAVLSDIHDSLVRHIDRFHGRERIFRENFTWAPDAEREKKQIFWKLQIPRAEERGFDKRLSNIRVRPFTTFRDAIRLCSAHLESNLQPGGLSAARQALASMFLVTRAFKADRIVEDLKVALIDSRRNPAEALNTARRNLKALMERPSLFSSPVGIERSAFGDDFRAQCISLSNALAELQNDYLRVLGSEFRRNNGEPLVDERAEVINAASERLAEYDFEAFVRDPQFRAAFVA